MKILILVLLICTSGMSQNITLNNILKKKRYSQIMLPGNNYLLFYDIRDKTFFINKEVEGEEFILISIEDLKRCYSNDFEVIKKQIEIIWGTKKYFMESYIKNISFFKDLSNSNIEDKMVKMISEYNLDLIGNFTKIENEINSYGEDKLINLLPLLNMYYCYLTFKKYNVKVIPIKLKNIIGEEFYVGDIEINGNAFNLEKLIFDTIFFEQDQDILDQKIDLKLPIDIIRIFLELNIEYIHDKD